MPELRFLAGRSSLAGVWTMQVWVYSARLLPDESAGFALLNKQTSMLVVLLAVALVYALARPRTLCESLDYPLALTTCAGTALSTLALCLGWPGWVCVVGALAGGAGVGWSYIRWGYLYSQLDTRTVMLCTFSAALFGTVVKAALLVIPLAVSNAVCVGLAAASPALLRRAQEELPDAGGRLPVFFSGADLAGLWKVALCVAVVTVACSVLNDGVAPEQATLAARLLSRFVEVGIFAAMLLAVGAGGATFGFAQFWSLILLFTGGACFLAAAGVGSTLAFTMSGVAINLVVYYFWVALADVVHHSDAHPYVVFSLGWSAYLLPRVLRGFVGIYLVRSAQGTAEVLLLATLLVACYLLWTRDPAAQRIFSDMDDARASLPGASLEERCAAVGARAGLTGREVEVVGLLCRGRSKAYIGETLSISENTVKAHAKRIYRKLGIHSRQELLDIVESEAGGGSSGAAG